MMGLTPRAAECLAIIRDGIARDGKCPPYARIAERMGLRSTGNVVRLIKLLEERGHLTRQNNIALVENGAGQ